MRTFRKEQIEYSYTYFNSRQDIVHNDFKETDILKLYKKNPQIFY